MDDQRRPLYSLYEDDPELEDEIDAFVIRLGESIDELQDAEKSGDVDHLDELATAMAGQAARLGFPDLEKGARLIRAACEDDDRGSLQQLIVDLTGISLRIRQGHRGAA